MNQYENYNSMKLKSKRKIEKDRRFSELFELKVSLKKVLKRYSSCEKNMAFFESKLTTKTTYDPAEEEKEIIASNAAKKKKISRNDFQRPSSILKKITLFNDPTSPNKKSSHLLFESPIENLQKSSLQGSPRKSRKFFEISPITKKNEERVKEFGTFSEKEILQSNLSNINYTKLNFKDLSYPYKSLIIKQRNNLENNKLLINDKKKDEFSLTIKDCSCIIY